MLEPALQYSRIFTKTKRMKWFIENRILREGVVGTMNNNWPIEKNMATGELEM